MTRVLSLEIFYNKLRDSRILEIMILAIHHRRLYHFWKFKKYIFYMNTNSL